MSSIKALNVNHPEIHENLNETKYNIIRDAVLSAFSKKTDKGGISFLDMEEAVRGYLIKKKISMDLFPKPGSIRWYTKAVQLDLEARSILERVPGQVPLRFRLIPSKK
ncbi:MAG: hypothetical protein IPG44_08590 [Anaerolineales bacterium]|jgi:hypothetical protein|nr:hypothetical protein [Chloroflexota bacterium]MBK6645799.1 hypothetical protein [Anaerolineales bacterium]